MKTLRRRPGNKTRSHYFNSGVRLQMDSGIYFMETYSRAADNVLQSRDRIDVG